MTADIIPAPSFTAFSCGRDAHRDQQPEPCLNMLETRDGRKLREYVTRAKHPDTGLVIPVIVTPSLDCAAFLGGLGMQTASVQPDDRNPKRHQFLVEYPEEMSPLGLVRDYYDKAVQDPPQPLTVMEYRQKLVDRVAQVRRAKHDTSER